MTAMNMRSRLVELVRRLRRWLLPVVLLALAPKCVLCLLAYTGAGTALGLGGRELCGAAGPDRSWAIALPLLSVTMVAATVLARRSRTPQHALVHSDGNTSSSSTSKIRPDKGGTLPAWMLP